MYMCSFLTKVKYKESCFEVSGPIVLIGENNGWKTNMMKLMIFSLFTDNPGLNNKQYKFGKC